MMGEVKMRQSIEPQEALHRPTISLQELPRISSARVRYHQADVQIVGSFRKLVQKALLRQIRHHGAVLHVKIFREFLSHLIEQTFPSRYQHYIEPRSRKLPGEFRAYAGRGAGDERPRPESFPVDLDFHLRFFLLRFMAGLPAMSGPSGASHWPKESSGRLAAVDDVRRSRNK